MLVVFGQVIGYDTEVWNVWSAPPPQKKKYWEDFVTKVIEEFEIQKKVYQYYQ